MTFVVDVNSWAEKHVGDVVGKPFHAPGICRRPLPHRKKLLRGKGSSVPTRLRMNRLPLLIQAIKREAQVFAITTL